MSSRPPPTTSEPGHTDPVDAIDAPDAAAAGGGAGDDVAAMERRFRSHLETRGRLPLRDALERYGDALREIVHEMRELTDAPRDDESERGPRSRHEYADRFLRAFRPDLLDPADRSRAELFRRLDAAGYPAPELPESITAGPADPTAAAADPLIRPRLTQRLMTRLRRNRDRVVPTAALARLYLAELESRLEAAAGRAASLDSVALAVIRRQLHDHADPEPPPALGEPTARAVPDIPEDEYGELEQVLVATTTEIDTAVAAIGDSFSRALRAPAIHVDDSDADELRERVGQRREQILREWQSFEEALHANTVTEAVLARALASVDETATRAANELDDVLHTLGRQPLDRLAEGLRDLARRAEAALDEEGGAAAIETLRGEAMALFEAELPQPTSGLRAALEDVARQFVESLDAIPGTVPDGLRLSEERIGRVPDDPRTLELRDVPLEELLGAACRGALPRWIERALATIVEELDALRLELTRVRNAVDFHIRAPLRGGFDPAEAVELVVGSMARAASQLEEFRDHAFDAIERIIPELERRSAEEAEDVRSAVAEREFLRIRSEIAEEEAVRRLSTGVDWGRRLVSSGLRIARRGWAVGRGTFDRTQDWAERQLGVAEVEREEMLETLEESLLSEGRARVAIPGLYRQVFDVEGEVPWDELLVERDAELAALGRAFDRWRRGQSGAVAVVGETGSGKTTLLRMAADLFGDAPVRTMQVGGTLSDPAELADRLSRGLELEAEGEDATPDLGELAQRLGSIPPTVVIVEDAHHMFIRALGGFTAMEAFLELVAATRREVFWIITVDEYAWEYLDRVLGMTPHFSHVISTTNLSPEKVERAVMARHEVSGFGLRFELEDEAGDASGWWSRLRKREAPGELSRRELQRRAFFRTLNQVAEGNVFLALFYWLRSVDRVEEHDLVLRKPEIIDLEFLERLPLPSLHTIAGIILHGGLSELEHRRVFQLDAPESRLQIATLADAHLIFRSDDGEYRVNKVLYRPLIRLLKTRNIF